MELHQVEQYWETRVELVSADDVTKGCVDVPSQWPSSYMAQFQRAIPHMWGHCPLFAFDDTICTRTLPALAHFIPWRPPDEGITLVELFGGIHTRLAAVLEVGLTVRQYVYVVTNLVATCTNRHHLHHLMILYPRQLPPTAICRCFGHLCHDITLVSEEDLRRLGPVDLVTGGWAC